MRTLTNVYLRSIGFKYYKLWWVIAFFCMYYAQAPTSDYKCILIKYFTHIYISIDWKEGRKEGQQVNPNLFLLASLGTREKVSVSSNTFVYSVFVPNPFLWCDLLLRWIGGTNFTSLISLCIDLFCWILLNWWHWETSLSRATFRSGYSAK